MGLPAVDPASRLTALIGKAEPRLRLALQNAVASALASSTLDELTDLIQRGLFEEAIDAASRIGAIRLADEYAAVFTLAGQDTIALLEDVLEIAIGFDQVNVRAVEVMRQERLRFIREFTAEQREATREALTQGIIRGDNPIDQARTFRRSIGLTRTQQQAVDNYRRLLREGSSEALGRQLRDRRFDSTVRRSIKTGEPLSSTQVDRMVGRYSERYVKYRSEVIGRTEALRAVHQGSEEAYEQAIEQGVIQVDQLERTWNDADDSRVRSSHVRLDGKVRMIGETFPGRDGPLRFPGDPQAPATETVQCRCVLSTRIANASSI